MKIGIIGEDPYDTDANVAERFHSILACSCESLSLNPPLNFSHEGIYNAVQSTKEHEENHGSQDSLSKRFGRSRNPFLKATQERARSFI